MLIARLALCAYNKVTNIILYKIIIHDAERERHTHTHNVNVLFIIKRVICQCVIIISECVLKGRHQMRGLVE